MTTQDHHIPAQLAKMYANNAVAKLVIANTEAGPPSKGAFIATPPPYLEDWFSDNIYILESGDIFAGSSPLDIYDISGRLLFRDWVTTLTGGKELRARTVATKHLSVPVPTVGINQPWPITDWLERAHRVAVLHELIPVDGLAQLVCYSYPKLGLMCRKKNAAPAVIDLSDGSIIEMHIDQPVLGDEAGMWSPLDSVNPDAAEESIRFFDAKAARLCSDGSVMLTAGIEAGSQQNTQQNVLTGMVLYGQETPVWCAVATGEMLLAYHNIKDTQTNIAVAMNAGPAGTTLTNQVSGLNRLAGKGLYATSTTQVTFENAQTEINGGRPLKSGIPGHARAVSGWRVNDGTKWLFIFDPWPVKQGQTVWEAWDTSLMKNFIYLQERTTP
jgi:hypothetical protein